ncbi:putative RNA-directed DNA polymerase, eukaryota, reverse transcriptase zinc-binding domain protein [Tanacetum coccineum]
MSARGISGGIIYVWNNTVFCKYSISCYKNYVAVEGLWIPNNIKIMWITVYAPKALSSKIALWNSLATMIANWDGILVVMGDFNEVREAGERFGSHFNERQADIVNTFISNASLIDVPLSGYKFTYYFRERWKVFVIWLLIHGITMALLKLMGWFHLRRNSNILSMLLGIGKRSDSSKLKKEHLSRLSSIDVLIDQGRATELDLLNHCDSIHLLGDLDQIEATDLAQKARIKWALEGDENSNLFHATLKKNRHQLAIKGILNEGEWIENTDKIKTLFVDHFWNRFQQTCETSSSFDVGMPNHISCDQRELLERSFSQDEIKKAVWDCGGDRAPGPDGFTFSIFTTFWDILESDVIRFVQEFFFTSSFPKGCYSSFIALIPKVSNATLVTDFHPISLIGCQYKIAGKILSNRLSMVIGSCISPEQYAFIKGRNIIDGPLILNEVIEWYRKRKKQLVIFKVDFEKAFDSLRWDFLDLVMAKLGFGIRWYNWIKDCLQHARSFVCKAMNCGIYSGAYIGKDNLRISHLIYADDVIFTDEWSHKNAHNLLCILRCFFLVSGLKINVHKSSILGICVSDEEISAMANVIGCGASKLPLKYPGVPVGCNMARCANWDVITNKFSSKLSHWKTRMIFVGGRLSLIKSVLSSLPTYFFSLYKAPVSLCSKLESMRNNFFIGGEMGGLGIGSIFALNVGLLFKWIWRFMQNSSDLWARVIKAIYGHNGGIHTDSTRSSNQVSTIGYQLMLIADFSPLGQKRRQFLHLQLQGISSWTFFPKDGIIAVTMVEIFKEGDFHRLRIQDIEDMLLLLVQGKVTNLSVEECIAFNVSLRMFTRRVVIQEARVGR